MKFDLIALAVIIVVWIVLYYAVFRHWLLEYKVTAGTTQRIEAAEGSAFKTLMIWLEAKKAAAVLFLTSLFGAAHQTAVSTVAATKATASSAATTVNALQPSDLDPLKDANLWHAFLSDGMVMKLMSGLAIAAALLTVKGHVTAAKIVPAPGTAATPQA